jgi:hypothetical protein
LLQPENPTWQLTLYKKTRANWARTEDSELMK